MKLDKPIIGLQMDGQVSVVTDEEVVRKIMEDYVAKYGEGKDFYRNFVTGTNQHHLYKFVPVHIVLFDEVNFAGDPRKDVSI